MLTLNIARDGRSITGRKLYKTHLSSTTNSNYISMDNMTASDLRDLVARIAEQAVITGQDVHYTGDEVRIISA